MRLTAVLALAVSLSGCASPLRHGAGSGIEGEPGVQASERARQIVREALRQRGVPYRHGGESPDAGFDCSGLVRYAFARAGIALPRDTRALAEAGTPVARGALEPGDLVFFNTLDRPFSHVGIYVGEGLFVHAPTARGAVEIARLNARYWSRRFDGARRIAF